MNGPLACPRCLRRFPTEDEASRHLSLQHGEVVPELGAMLGAAIDAARREERESQARALVQLLTLVADSRGDEAGARALREFRASVLVMAGLEPDDIVEP